MPRWHQPYLGLTECPADLTTFELDFFFTFTPEELEALKSRYKPLLRLGAAIQFGFLKMAGCPVASFKVVPRELLRHLGEQLGETAPSIASLRTLYQKRRRTLYEHQSWAIERLGLGDLSERQERMLFARLRDMGRSCSSRDLLVQFAREWLYERKLLIPAARRLRDLARRALVYVEEELFEAIAAAIPQEVRERWLRDLTTEFTRAGQPLAEWLDQGPKRGIRKGLGEQQQKLQVLRRLGVPAYPLETIALEKQRFYAPRMRRRRPSRFAELREPRRTLELVCFLRMALTRTTDAILHMTRQRTADLVREAQEDALREDARNALTYREAVEAIRTAVEDSTLGAEAVREEVRRVLGALKPKAYASRAAAVRNRLLEKGPAIRSLLKSVTTLPLDGTANEPARQSIRTLKDIYAREQTTLDVDMTPSVKPMWRREVTDADRSRALRAFEAATLLELRRALRRGSVWAQDSLEFRDRDRLLIAPARWAKERQQRYAHLGVPERADRFLASLSAVAERGLAAVARAVEAGHVSVGGEALHLPALTAEELPKDLAATRAALFRAIGDVQLPEAILEIDSHTHFSWALLGRAAQSERELLTLYGAILAHGTELDASGVALMTPGLDAREITAAMRGLEDDRVFRRANEAVVEFIRRHATAKHWGDGSTASADMMSLDTSRHLWRARMDPRRRTPAVGIYQHVLDQWSVFYDLPIVLLDRQAGAAIEGVIRQTELEIERLAVDTHGYTDFAMATAKLLGFDLCPRLKNLRGRKLFVPGGMAVPKVLEPVIDRDVSMRAIRRGWDELIRVAASIETGTVSAVLALERFGSAAQGDKTHRAGTHLGRLVRTVYLCDYFSNPVFRRELHRILNHGESVHALERAIYVGRVSPARGRRPEEWVAISGALTLLTNLVLAWNTHRAQSILDDWGRTKAKQVPGDILAHVSPAHFGNMNFRGTFRFPLERYRDRLLGSAGRSRMAVVG
jgi:TnpA family transposase